MTTIKVILTVAFGGFCLVVLSLLGQDNDRDWTLKRSTFDQIEAGMTLVEVEALLGPGQPNRGLVSPRISGDETLEWQEWEKDWKPRSQPYTTRSNRRIVIGFLGGRVCDKRFFEPSL